MKVTILGANGRIARIAERFMAADSDIELRLFLRHAERLAALKGKAAIFEGDATNVQQVQKAIEGTDIVYANLAGDDIVEQAKTVIEAMKAAKVKRLIWISTLGIYDEVPGAFGKWNRKILGGYITRYAKAAKLVSDSGLDETIIRPTWLTDDDEVDYEKTYQGQEITTTQVSRKSVAAYVFHLVRNPKLDVHRSVGLGKPGTQGDKPSWY